AQGQDDTAHAETCLDSAPYGYLTSTGGAHAGNSIRAVVGPVPLHRPSLLARAVRPRAVHVRRGAGHRRRNDRAAAGRDQDRPVRAPTLRAARLAVPPLFQPRGLILRHGATGGTGGASLAPATAHAPCAGPRPAPRASTSTIATARAA